MLRALLSWWWEQLRDLFAFARMPASALLVTATQDFVVVRLQRRGREHELGRFARDASGISALRGLMARRHTLRCILLLPPASLLERIVTLPLAVESDWQRVVGYEMDRLTPFAAEDLFWAGSVMRRDRTQGRLELLLSVVLRVPLQPLLTSLAQAGLVPDALQAAAPDGATRLIGLDNAMSRRDRRARRAVAVAGGICAVLVLAALVLPFILQGLALQLVDQRIAALRPAVQQVEILRRGMAEGAVGASGVEAVRSRTADPLAVLAAVTDALPDDTSLTSLSLGHGALSLTGQSGGAARLIGALSASPHIRNPAFSAPVTRNEAAHTDQFSLRAEVSP